MKHILSLVVNNSSGVLSHVSGLFTRRAYNIDSLSVGETQDSRYSTITLVVKESQQKIKQIENQLSKLIDVVSIKNLTGAETFKRELTLIKVKAVKDKRLEILNLVNVYAAKVVDMTNDEFLIEFIALPRRVNSFINILEEFGIIEIARTGTIALSYSSLDEENTIK